ncbi:hypothetical protein ACXR2U_06245 [Jatrophihabitans sp. YIM 134969]
MSGVAAWVEVVESPASSVAATRAAVEALLAADPRLGASTVLGVLSLPPRYRPSRGLLVDPGDDAHRRWERKVAVTRALLASPAATLVADELADELADCPELAAAVRADADSP